MDFMNAANSSPVMNPPCVPLRPILATYSPHENEPQWRGMKCPSSIICRYQSISYSWLPPEPQLNTSSNHFGAAGMDASSAAISGSAAKMSSKKVKRLPSKALNWSVIEIGFPGYRPNVPSPIL